jgi:FkbM family methyltransferase
MDRLPAAISLPIRAEPKVRRLLGMHAPAELIARLVPPGRNAVDVGANRGIYTYWIHRKAAFVDAFEPQPALARYLRAARLRRVRVHEVALSDRAGTAQLVVPDHDDGLARLSGLPPVAGPGSPVEPAPPGRELGVATLPLDAFGLEDVGFLKIDVEGHELAVLAGAAETVQRSRPVVFVESEARHAAGAPGNVVDLMLGPYGYRRAAFVRHWEPVDIDRFSVERDQLAWLPDAMHEAYVSNFVFWP